MSDKMLCPGCGSETSGIRMAVEDDRPCPECGLSADAILEVDGIRAGRQHAALRDQLRNAIIARDRSATEATALRRIIDDIRAALERDP